MKFYIVGGAVRDYVLGKHPKDIDYVVVGATPEDMLDLGLKQVGADFPVFIDDEGTEVALARTERKTGVGYNGFTTDHSKTVTLEEDLSRRDLTINAMAMDRVTNQIIDPFGGEDDLNAKLLRHVSPAFVEDPVRVLRIARFRARYGGEWTITDDTKALMKAMARRGDLSHLTRERVLLEMEKAFSEPYPELFFTTLQDVDALKIIFPELVLVDHLDVLEIRKYAGASPATIYAVVALCMSDVNALHFEARMNVSTEWRRAARMYRAMMSCRMDSNQVDILYKMDAYRQPQVWDALLRDLVKVGKSREKFYNDLFVVWCRTEKMGFIDLTDEQRATLKGPEIAEAIKQLRRKVVTNG
ncbi:multifunctional CCA addition/repair protein [Xanthomonas phage BUDD]|nr:multifunctional CCA addition/repair protein [Xanthomonas phage BUDD]